MSSFKNFSVHSLPSIAKLEFKRIHENYLKVILANTFFIFLLIFIALFLVIKFKLKDVIPEFTLYIYILFFLIVVVFSVVLIFGFSKRKYAIREKDISYKKGFFFKSFVTVPFSRIQHLEVDESPLSRFFKLASLSIYTAGDSSTDLEINGLNREEAFQIKDYISAIINEK